jgi:3-phosphoshikimate 1-carboxyvinyltransferase
MGATIWGRDGGRLAPLAMVPAELTGIEYESPVASAQVKSALLLAGLFASGRTTVREPSRSRDHTERMLAAMQAPVAVDDTAVSIERPAGPLRPLSLAVPGDISAAAFWLVAGSIHPDADVVIESVGLNQTRTGVLDILRSMGADVEVISEHQEGGEPVGDLRVRSARLRGTVVEGDLVPRAIDELPVIALAAAVARGETVIRDAAELRVKESDRVAAVARELGRLGAEIEPRPDGFQIEGDAKLAGAEVESHGDHRLAMTLAVAGLVSNGEVAIADADCVAVSYPRFWKDLTRLSTPA